MEPAEKPSGKVIRVNFRGFRKTPPGSFGGGAGFLFAVFAATLAAELAAAALFIPRWMTSGFFAPIVVVVAVLAATGARRLRVRWEVARLHRRVRAEAVRRSGEETRHTIH